MSLNRNVIRTLASKEGYKEIYFNEKSKVISFCSQQGHSDNSSIRINIYWSTGTVGTCLNHPRQGKTQLFRRSVDIVQLRSIFKNPRVHTGSGYHHGRKVLAPLSLTNNQDEQTEFNIGDSAYAFGSNHCTIKSSSLNAGRIKVKCDDGQVYLVLPHELQIYKNTDEILGGETLGEEAEAKSQLQWLTNEMSFLHKQKEQVTAIIDKFEEERRQKAAAEAAKRERQKRLEEEAQLKAAAQEAERQRQAQLAEAQIAAVIEASLQEEKRLAKEALKESRGKYLDYTIYNNNHVDKCFNENIISMSCGGNATIMLYENGTWAWTSGLTKLLHNKLNGRQLTLPAPTYVVVGSCDRYYISFKDGKSEWAGCEEMTEKLQSEHNARKVKSVAFGEDWDSYFIVFDDGGWACNNIPNDLSDLLERRKCRGDLTCVSLGPNGEYYLSARNGRAWWGGSTSDNMERINKCSSRIKFLDFGEDNTYILRYS